MRPPKLSDTSNQPQTFMLYDIAALQQTYGPDHTSNGGKSVYTFSAVTGEMFIDGVGQGQPTANIVFRTVWDGGGFDTYKLGSYGTPTRVDLRPGGWLVFDIDPTGGFLQRADHERGINAGRLPHSRELCADVNAAYWLPSSV